MLPTRLLSTWVGHASGSSLSLAVALDSPAPGAGVVAVRLRVFAGADARVDVAVTQTLDDGWIALDDAGIVLDERARMQVRHTVLGAGRAYTGLDADLRGDETRASARHALTWGMLPSSATSTTSRTSEDGAPCTTSTRTACWRANRRRRCASIELVHGCKGSVGSEQETVLLADERVANRTVPVILCDEDDVAGNHGATIGHVRPEQLASTWPAAVSRRTTPSACSSPPPSRKRPSTRPTSAPAHP